MAMPSMDMGSISNDIHSIEYSENGLTLSEKYSILSPNPHAIDFDGRYIYTVSNSSDQIVKIDTFDGTVTYTPIRLSDGLTGGRKIQALKPLCLNL